MSLIGQRIQEYREAKGWSRPKLAEETGLSRVTIWKIETGLTSPVYRTVEQIAKALEIPTGLLST